METIEQIIQNSPWNINANYTVKFRIFELLNGISEYINDEDESLEINNWSRFFDISVPNFQRSNDKWTEDMQISYIENLICGLKSEICFYTISNTRYSILYTNCKILDGLQRLTAISKFLDNKLKVFDNFYCSDIRDEKCLRGGHFNISVKIYNFKNESDVVKFYIAMNENITHSKEDIYKAKNYLVSLS